ncbi:MAG: L-threonylcarbamoyladenylate synthase [Candidatus Dojkabacteria bacterium]|nr:L-threonylcarbamoyladenylate synthase [Candidatus Dojkabacteria bacterium]
MYRIIDQNDSTALDQAVSTLKQGGLIVYPTETCYGLGADATNQKAVDKLLQYKTRREGKPISIAVTGRDMAQQYSEINEIAENLYENYLPGPLTIVSKATTALASGVASEYETIGIRVPDYPFVIEMIRTLGRPVTATSANVSYKNRPYSIPALIRDLPEKQKHLLDLIIDAGELPHNEVSTVVDTTLNSLNVMRSGQIEFQKKGTEILRAETNSAEETADFGAMTTLKFRDQLRSKCLLFALGGELGSGKTQFTKGIARQLGISKTITSPTFNLVLEYPYKQGAISGLLVHIDTWRLSTPEEFDALHIEQFITPGAIIAIEWADKFFDRITELAQNKTVRSFKVSFTSPDLTKRTIAVHTLE